MLKKFFCCFSFIISLCLSQNVWAISQSVSTDRVSVNLITDKNCVKPNEDLQVLIKLQIKEGWHTYWKNPGDTGDETKIGWELPAAYSDEIVEISSPSVYLTEGIYQYIHSDAAYFLIKLKNHITSDEAKNTHPLEYHFKTNISWIICGDECLTEKVSLAFSININNLDHLYTTDWKNEIKIATKTFPKSTNWDSFYEVLDNGTLLLNFDTKEEIKNIKKIKFLPYQKELINNAEPQLLGQEANNLSLKISLDTPQISDLNGVLLIDNEVYNFTPIQKKGLSIYAQKNTEADKETLLTQTSEIEKNFETSLVEDADVYSFWAMMLFALLGGLILNLMPCIFPILTLKAMSIINGSKNQKENKVEALMYLLGVVVCFLVIATLLIILRATGEKIGWGFQLQSPIFVVVMIVLFFLIFLMMLDIITIKNPFSRVGRISFKEQRLNSFITGLFSVLIATPCTAPFMGAAIAYTLSKPLYIYYPVFIVLSVGYAIPFTLLGFFPSLVHKLLPKPGKWMITLKKILSIPILLTCVWLTWVLYSQINVKAVELKIDEEVTSNKNIVWQIYDENKIEKLLEQGEPVFIDFTAKWCITCLANKKIALDTNAFDELVKKHHIHLFRADWTNYSPDIEAALQKYGRNSIPLYVYYPTGEKKYQLLPQLITPGILRKYIEE